MAAALETVFLDPQVLWVVIASAAFGVFVGAIPGLTATMAVALMVPMTFFLSDVQAIAAIVTTVTCSIFAGDFPSTLVRIPGTPASAAYADDAYAIAQGGAHRLALFVSLVFSVSGGFLGALILMLCAPQLARVATLFTSYEYFWLYVLGLSCAVVVSDESRLRGIFALLLGLLLSSVGLGADYSAPRLTFGIDELITGIHFIPAMIGLFGVSEVLRNASRLHLSADKLDGAKDARRTTHSSWLHQAFGGLGESLDLLRKRVPHLLRSSGIGSFVGMLPGAGADIAAWMSYAVSKRFSKSPERYGRGSLEGLSDATGANNAALGSAWIPALVFGIPGDSVTAIGIGVLLMKNITPGPDIFVTNSETSAAPLAYCVIAAFLAANVFLIPIGSVAIQLAGLLVRVPRNVLVPSILLFCLVGSFAMNASYFDVIVMLVMGVLGFVLERLRVPLGPVVLGIILGGEAEHRFIQCLMKSEGMTSFFTRPVSLVLALASLLLLLGVRRPRNDD